MVLQKRIDYGFSGYRVPTTTRATRSARRRATCQKIVKDNQTSAFDILASVAGKLLQHKETSTTSSDTSSEKDQHGFVMEDSQNTNKLKTDLSDGRSCDRRYFSDHSSQARDQNISLKEISRPENDCHSSRASKVTSSTCSLVNGQSHNQMENLVSTVESGSSGSAESSGCKLDGDISNKSGEQIGVGTEKCSFEDPLDGKPPALISSGGDAKLSGCDNNIPCSTLSKHCDNIPVVSRDDDENRFGCIHPSAKAKLFRPMTCRGDRRIRKILASKYWKLSSESKDDKLLGRDGNLKPIYQSRMNCYKRQRSEMNIPFKKRKLFYHKSLSNSDRFIRSDGTCHPFEKGMSQDASGLSPRMCRDPGMSSLGARQDTGLQCRDSHVKLRIKSLRVPELFIEIPETATIGSLKRTVMEAVTAILGGELHVGIILQGKKVRDDNKTLIQTGISQDNQQDAVGFTLEPNSLNSIQPVCAVHSPHVPHADMPRHPPNSSPATVHQRIQCSSDMVAEHQVTGISNLIESDHDSAPSPNKKSVDESLADSKAMVTVPQMGMEALGVIPMHQKTKQSQVVQRRIRRPFSIAEVEALIQAVEKLGTGRWRDVKLCAFDDTEHRTYVDLKDKWKTLVHTARISPQKRRGETVPQELLDRVLMAHHYWSHHQTKQHVADF